MHVSSGGANLNGGDDAARFMEETLSRPVRRSIEAVLHEHPRDPVRYLAQTLLEQQDQQQPHSVLEVPARTQEAVKEAVSAFTAIAANKNKRHSSHTVPIIASPPLSLTLGDGQACKVRQLSTHFAHASASTPPSSELPPAFPSVLYREAASLYEVGSCLRRLQQLTPQASVVLFIEAPAPTSTVFFYEGEAYACTPQRPPSSSRGTATDCTDMVRAALSGYGGTVLDFAAAVQKVATEAAAGVHVEFLPAVQTNYLDAFDQLTRTLDEAQAEGRARSQSSTDPAAARASASVLPSVLLVSYRADTARLTYARLLAAYGPLYEAAQRVALTALRLGQLERKRKFTFAYAMEYWAQVQRRRETSSGGGGNSKIAADVSVSVSDRDGSASLAAVAAAAAAAAAAGTAVRNEAAAKALAKEKRAAARSVKRGLPAYDADQQAEDDVFLVVIRRLEHAAATLIQSVFRGHRARKAYAEKKAAAPRDERRRAYPTVASALSGGGSAAFSEKMVAPLLRAAADRLREEGKALDNIWEDFATSPPPDSRRCWIYRPVQRTVKATTGGDASRTREDWVQEELLIPPLRATQPRVHINILQRLLDYLDVAQCTLWTDTSQLFADSPGMSVLQRRAYDGVKSLCLTLFYVAYGELRQRHAPGVPSTFSQYMRENHDVVMTWCNVPHACSLFFTAVREAAAAGHRVESTNGKTVNGNRSDDGVEDLTDVAAVAAGEVVRRRLDAHEAFLVAYERKAAAQQKQDGAAPHQTLHRLSQYLYVSSQPLLPTEEWRDAVRSVAKAMETEAAPRSPNAAARGRPASELRCVHWWSAATEPLCVANRRPVAASLRWDGQMLDDVPAYDCFVPRVRTVGANTIMEEVVNATLLCDGGDAASSRKAAPCGEAVVMAWLRGDLMSAADAALAVHIRRVMSSEKVLECYRSTKERGAAGGTFSSSFAAPSPCAVLTRFIAAKVSKPSVQAQLEDSLQVESAENVSQSNLQSSLRRRSMERGGGWERVMEAVALEAAASRRNSPRQSSIVTSPRASVSASGWSHHTSLQPSPSGGAYLSPLDSPTDVEGGGERLTAAKQENTTTITTSAVKAGGFSVYSVEEVAGEVAKKVREVAALQHTRRALRFVRGMDGARRVDDFIDRVATCVINSAPCDSRLVLSLDVASQAFFAVAAVLIEHRLLCTRDASVASPPNTGEDGHLAFLKQFHETLQAALKTSSLFTNALSTPKKEASSAQLAVQHVSAVMRAADSQKGSAASSSRSEAPHLDLLSRIERAMHAAEAASATMADVQTATLAAVQLAEQYAWLVLLDLYLWSPHFPYVCSAGFPPARRKSLSSQSGTYQGFAEMMAALPAVTRWVEQMDPWATTPERCPDPLHRRYSNGLRRWDDKHYVCFGAL